MASRPPSQILDTFTIHTAAGFRRTVHRWSEWIRAGEVWVEGIPVLRTDDGFPVWDLGERHYTIGESDEIFTADG